MKVRHQLPAYSPVSAKAALLATGQLFGLRGDPRPALRALLEREYGATSVLLCGSGTQALTVAIQEARRRVDPDAPVALPAFSCFDVASAAVGADVRVSLYDLDPDTLGPDLESLERVLRAGAGAVVVAPLYGTPVDWDILETLAARYSAVLIEDAAQGNGASWRGRRLGSLGEIAVLSFGRGKGWTGGSGGAVLQRTTTRHMLTEIPTSDFGQDAKASLSLVAQWIFGRPALYGFPLLLPGIGLGETIYRPPMDLSSIPQSSAAVLLSTYEASKHEAEVRKINANRIREFLLDCRCASTFQMVADADAGYLRLPVRIRDGYRNLNLRRNALALGVAGGYPRILADLSQLGSRLCGPDHSWHGSQTLVRELITIPTHSRLSAEDLFHMVGVLREIL